MEKLLFVNEHNFTVKFKKKNQAGFYSLKKKMLPFQISPSLVSHPNMGGWSKGFSLFFINNWNVWGMLHVHFVLAEGIISPLPFELIQIKALILSGQHPKIAGMMGSHLIIISTVLNSMFKTNEQRMPWTACNTYCVSSWWSNTIKYIFYYLQELCRAKLIAVEIVSNSNEACLFPPGFIHFWHHWFKYLRLHSFGREGSCCWFSGCHSPPPLMNRLVRDPENGRSAPIMPGTVSRWAVGPAGGLSWLQISGVTNALSTKYLW